MAISLLAAVPPPALAAQLRPYVRVGAEAAYEANVTGRYTVAEEPYRSFYAKGLADLLGVSVLDAGSDIDFDERFSLYAGLGAKAIGYANYPAFSYLSGNAILEASAVDLPGNLDAAVACGYRDDFQGWRGQWASATVERPLAWAVAGYASAGYDWSAAVDPRFAREGPFLDLGVRRRFRDTGTSVRAGLGASRPSYGSGRIDTSLSASLGVSQRLVHGVYATLRARFDVVESSEASRTYSAPAVAIGTAWILP